jgi:hypothetical protein
MRTAVIHFENIENVAIKFRNLLEKYGLIFGGDPDLLWQFVSYVTLQGNNAVLIKKSAKVAEDAAKWISESNIERLVFITDLSPIGSESMAIYGLDVLAKIVEYLWVQNVRNLVADENILVAFLTAFDLKKALKQHEKWKNIEIKVIGYGDRGRLPNVTEALKELQENDRAIIHIDRVKDEEWASQLIAEWVKSGLLI